MEDKPVLSRIHSDESWKDCRSTICSPLEKSPLTERKPLSSNGQLNLSSQDLRFIDDDRSIEITSPKCVDENVPKFVENNNVIDERKSKTQEAKEIVDDILKNPSIVKLLKDRSSTNEIKSDIESVLSSSNDKHKEPNKIVNKDVSRILENDIKKLSLKKQLSLATDDECKKKSNLDRQSISQDLTINLSSSQELAVSTRIKNGIGPAGILKCNEFKSQQMLNMRPDRSCADQSLFNNKSASQQLLFNAATEAYQQRLKNDFKSQQLFESRPMNRAFKSQQTLTKGVRIQLMEYYNDHEQCLEEYRRQKAEEEEQKRKQEEQAKINKEKEEKLRIEKEKIERELNEKLKRDENERNGSGVIKIQTNKKNIENQYNTNIPIIENNKISSKSSTGVDSVDKADYEGKPQ